MPRLEQTIGRCRLSPQRMALTQKQPISGPTVKALWRGLASARLSVRPSASASVTDVLWINGNR